MTLQWFHSGVPVAGATNRSLFISGLQGSNGGTYFLVASNAEGRATNQPVMLTVDPAPFVATARVFHNVPIGGHLCIEPEVLGTEPLNYRWQLNGINLVDGQSVQGSNSRQLCLQEAQPSQNGCYSLVVSNAYGVITGNVARVAVTEVVAWGDNSFGQSDVPPDATNILTVAAGGAHNLALRKDGTIIAWGDDSYGQNEIPEGASNVIAIAAGMRHSVAARADGQVMAWGDNAYGQTNVPFFTTNIIALAAGANHTLASLADGSIVAWGANNARQTNLFPKHISAISIAASGDQSLAVSVEGYLLGWGRPLMPFFFFPHFAAVAAGADYGLALRSDGSVIGWGNNSFGQISIPFFGVRPIGIASGDAHGIALLSDGTLICWGADFAGECSPPLLPRIRAIAAGGSHSLAIVGRPPPFAPPTFEILAPSLAITNGAFRLRVSNLTGQGSAVISATTNFLDWERIYTNPATVGSFEFVDPASTALPQRVYRAAEKR
jgi:hypothetical protein